MRIATHFATREESWCDRDVSVTRLAGRPSLRRHEALQLFQPVLNEDDGGRSNGCGGHAGL